MAVVENSVPSTRPGGITGAGFQPGVSATPAAALKASPAGSASSSGDDGHEIVVFMFEVMRNEKARMADRLEAAAWLADRGLGKAELAINIDLNRYPIVDLSQVATEDLET